MGHLAHERKRTTHQILGEPIATEFLSQLRGLLPELPVSHTIEPLPLFRHVGHDRGLHALPHTQPAKQGADKASPLAVQPPLLRHMAFRIGAVQCCALSRKIKH